MLSTVVEHDVLERIDDGRLVSVATALVQAGGENPPGGEQATVDVLTGTARDLGLDVTQSQVEPGRDNVRITLSGGDDPGLLLLGHTDVVPVGDGWTKDPFGGVVEEGRIYGRGTADMKGGLAAAITAMAALRGVELAGPVELAALVDEEETGKGIRAYVDAIRGGPGQRGFAGCIVAEPTDLQTIIGARGDCCVRVVVGGRACHAGNPGDGANAIYGAAAVVAEFERMHAELASRPHPLFGPASFSVGEIQGGNGAAVVPACCVVVADRRLLPGESPESVQATVSARLGALGLADRGLNIEVTVPMAMPPFETDREDRLVRHTDTALRRAGGPGLPLAGWSAACDGGFIARDLGVPVVVLGPGSVTTQAHRPDESVAIEQLVVAARAYALTVLGMLG